MRPAGSRNRKPRKRFFVANAGLFHLCLLLNSYSFPCPGVSLFGSVPRVITVCLEKFLLSLTLRCFHLLQRSRSKERKLRKAKKSPSWNWRDHHNHSKPSGSRETQAPHFLLANSQHCCTELWAPPWGSQPTSFISPLYPLYMQH